MAVSQPDSVGRSPTLEAATCPPEPAGPGRRFGTRRRGRKRRQWWQEIVGIAVFYGLYSAVRDLHGSRPVSAAQAFRNARRVIGFERTLGVFHEAQIQHAFLGDRFLIRLLDDWYGSTHFVITAVVLAWLFFACPYRYRLWRDTLAVATGLALIGFAFFPLMPPRLLPPSYGFTDTLRVVGGLWNFNSGPINHLSDQYAAMPSLHFAWALWCGLVLFSVAERPWKRILACCYPAITLWCVLVTANHYLSDTVAGAAIVAIGYVTAAAVDRRHRPEGYPVSGGDQPVTDLDTPLTSPERLEASDVSLGAGLSVEPLRWWIGRALPPGPCWFWRATQAVPRSCGLRHHRWSRYGAGSPPCWPRTMTPATRGPFGPAWPQRCQALAFPFLPLFAVPTTANHLLVDSLAGAATAIVAVAAGPARAKSMSRSRG